MGRGKDGEGYGGAEEGGRRERGGGAFEKMTLLPRGGVHRKVRRDDKVFSLDKIIHEIKYTFKNIFIFFS